MKLILQNWLRILHFPHRFCWVHICMVNPLEKVDDSSIFKGGKSSKRELMIYLTVGLWLLIGVFTIINGADLMGMSAYFAALTPFVGSYIIGESG